MANLYRKRLIPQECINLDKDEILLCTDTEIITRWKTINPKQEFASGISYYVIDKGWKISEFFNEEGNFIRWYCDIISTEIKDNSTYIFTDLLADVIIEEDGLVKVVDLDELADAFRDGLISGEELRKSMYQLNELLSVIYEGNFCKYTDIIKSYINK